MVFLTANPEQISAGFAGALGAVSKPFDEATLRAVVAFAREFIQHGTLGEAPRRFRLAPWLTPPPPASRRTDPDGPRGAARRQSIFSRAKIMPPSGSPPYEGSSPPGTLLTL